YAQHERVVQAGVDRQERRPSAVTREQRRRPLNAHGPQTDNDGDLHAAVPPRARGPPEPDPLRWLPPTAPIARAPAEGGSGVAAPGPGLEPPAAGPGAAREGPSAAASRARTLRGE